MCGIAGAFAYGADPRPVDASLIARINDDQRRRGPDGEGLWASPDGRVALGHRRLAIIDVGASGAQPMADATGRWTITFNGEIYNYRELRSLLEREGCAFRTNSDTEVLINLVAVWGEAGLARLRGMFAFALWDSLKRELWLARDPYGIKPLYVADKDGTLFFASQARALARSAPVERTHDPAAQTGFYLWGHVPEPFTWWSGIRAFPAGHVQRISADAPFPAPVPYLRIEDCYANAEPQPLAAGELVEILLDSVHHHLVSDVPVGVFLSAGVDSTVIAALAAELDGQLRTVTLAFDEFIGTDDDEAPLAEQTAHRLGTRHTTVRISRGEFEDLFDDFLLAMDQPSIDGLNTYLISRAAKAQGLKVVLSGLGGDELFGGYPSFRDVPRLLRLGERMPLRVPIGRAVERILRKHAPSVVPPKLAGMISHSGGIAAAYLLRRALHLTSELEALVDEEELRQGLERLQTEDAISRIVAPLQQRRRPVYGQISALESCLYMRNQLLRDTDWASMAHGVEVRVPFVDARLIERLAPAIASRSPPLKADLAACFPASRDQFARRKSGFVTPVGQWLTERTGVAQRGLRGWAEEVHRHFADADGGPRRRSTVSRAVPSRSGRASRAARSSRVLLFRYGSIGDFVVALPSLRLIRRSHPRATIALLTNAPISQITASAREVLDGMGLVDEYLSYPGGTRDLHKLLELRVSIRRFAPDRLIYLAPHRGFSSSFRDRLFFHSCRVRDSIGFQGSYRLHRLQPVSVGELWESEASRLARTLAVLGYVDAEDPANFDLALSAAETGEAMRLLDRIPGFGRIPLIALSIGTKQPINDWGDENWASVLRGLARPEIGLLIVGAAEDRQRSERLAGYWPGPVLDLCGTARPRVSAAALRQASLFLCHDSGPMHLAAAVGTRCVAVFSRRNPPGQWFPCGRGHRIFYPAHPNEKIGTIRPEQVIAAAREMIGSSVAASSAA